MTVGVPVDEQEPVRRSMPSSPLIYMFQPTSFEIVTGDRLREWEEAMRNHVLGPVAATLTLANSTGSWSFCGPRPSSADDCDADTE